MNIFFPFHFPFLTFFRYRLVNQGQSSSSKPKRSYSLPTSHYESSFHPKSISSGTASSSSFSSKSRRNLTGGGGGGAGKISPEGLRVTRSMSREQQKDNKQGESVSPHEGTHHTCTVQSLLTACDIRYSI